MVFVGARILPLSSSSSASPWLCGGACLSRASAASYKTSRSPFPLSLARASSSKSERTPPISESSSNLLPPEDVDYVVKLTLGSVAGAAAIKYGSLLLPSITRPNLVEALLIMGSPVVVAAAWLALASFQQREQI